MLHMRVCVCMCSKSNFESDQVTLNYEKSVCFRAISSNVSKEEMYMWSNWNLIYIWYFIFPFLFFFLIVALTYVSLSRKIYMYVLKNSLYSVDVAYNFAT